MSRFFAPISVQDLEKKVKEIATDGEDFDLQVLLDRLGRDIKVKFDTENYTSSGRGLLGCHRLPNGLTFWGMSASGDWEQPVFFIIYWDGKRLRGYVPTDGNLWNTKTRAAYGNSAIDDVREAQKRWPGRPLSQLEHDFNAIEKDIINRIKNGVRPLQKPKKSIYERLQELKFYAPGDEGGELFLQTCDLAYQMEGLNQPEKARTLYKWAKGMASDSKRWCREQGRDIKEEAFAQYS